MDQKCTCILILLYKTSALVGSEFGGTWEDPGGGFIKFAAKRALKQDQTLYMEGKLHIILYFREEWTELYVVDMYLYNYNYVRVWWSKLVVISASLLSRSRV